MDEVDATEDLKNFDEDWVRNDLASMSIFSIFPFELSSRGTFLTDDSSTSDTSSTDDSSTSVSSLTEDSPIDEYVMMYTSASYLTEGSSTSDSSSTEDSFASDLFISDLSIYDSSAGEILPSSQQTTTISFSPDSTYSNSDQDQYLSWNFSSSDDDCDQSREREKLIQSNREE